MSVHRATVARVAGQHVRLDSTIFFAFSGGQESDAGTIGGYLVEEAAKDGLDIVYTLPSDHGLLLGQEVDIVIDWQRRYSLMRSHFAAEMVLQLIYQQLPGIERIGAHIAPGKARIDFAYEHSLAPLIAAIQCDAQKLTAADLPIMTDYSDVELQRRYWKVDGFAQMPCGGTHPRSTGEIGPFTVKRRNPGSGKERVEITLG